MGVELYHPPIKAINLAHLMVSQKVRFNSLKLKGNLFAVRVLSESLKDFIESEGEK